MSNKYTFRKKKKIRKSLGSATSAAALAAKQGHAACVEALAFDANTGSVE